MPARTYTRDDAIVTLTGSQANLSIWVKSLEGVTGLMLTGPVDGPPLLDEGFHADLEEVDWPEPGFECADPGGWLAVDTNRPSTETVPGIIELRVELRCGSEPALHLKAHVDHGDNARPPGSEPIPDGLWDAAPAVAPGTSYVLLEPELGEPLVGSPVLTTKADAQLVVAEDDRTLRVDFSGETELQMRFLPPEQADELEVGYYADARWPGNALPLRGTFTIGYEHLTCDGEGWFAVDRLEREGGVLSELELRAEYRCDGYPTLRTKVVWSAADPTAPPGPTPVPAGLWDVQPPGTDASTSYVFVTGTPGTRDTFLTSPPSDFILRDYGSGSQLIADQGYYGFFLPAYDRRGLEPGFYGNVDTTYFGNPARPRLTWGSSADCHEVTGWIAVDRVDRVGDSITALILRFEQSCNGGPVIHGKVHIVPPGEPGVPLPKGPPIGSLDTLMGRVVEKLTIAGWAIDPDTSNPIDVHVYVDGVGHAVRADWARADVAAAYPGYGSAHGYSLTLDVPGGRHSVCAYGINVGVGGNSLLGCRDVEVVSGPPFGSLDVVSAGPGEVRVAGWAIDPDVVAPIDVHVYVDGRGVAVPAAGSRPDVGDYWSFYGPDHGFEVTVPASPGRHTVCAYGINVGVGSNRLLGCRDVEVVSGPPFGALDVVSAGPGEVQVAGWAIDPDVVAPIDVHVYVDGRGVAVPAAGSRPDVGVAYPTYGSEHGFGATVPASPGRHTVCAYGINVGAGWNSLLGCREVMV